MIPSSAAKASYSTLKNGAEKTAIVLMNMGGPEHTSGVKSFLTNLFSDQDLMKLPMQKYTAPLMAHRRTPKVEHHYSEIGGGSPIKKWTTIQGKMLEERLNNNSANENYKAYIAFRYTPPSTEHTVKELVAAGIQRAIAFTQYPQYSCSTTGSSLNELYRQVKKYDPERTIQWSLIDRWPTHPLFIKALANKVSEGLKKFSPEDRNDTIILFSAHSLPMNVVNRGDCYPAEVAATAQATMECLKIHNSFRVVWQSQVGPLPWLGPEALATLKGYASLGKKNILLVPIAFTSDHIETLYELDIEYAEHAKESGITNLHRADSFNDDPLFADALAALVKEHEASERISTHQWPLRCPKCTNEACHLSREFFLNSN